MYYSTTAIYEFLKLDILIKISILFYSIEKILSETELSHFITINSIRSCKTSQFGKISSITINNSSKKRKKKYNLI